MNVSLLCPTCDQIRHTPIGHVVLVETSEDTTVRWFPCPVDGWQHTTLRDENTRPLRDDERTDDIEDRRVQWLHHAGAVWLDFSDVIVDLDAD